MSLGRAGNTYLHATVRRTSRRQTPLSLRNPIYLPIFGNAVGAAAVPIAQPESACSQLPARGLGLGALAGASVGVGVALYSPSALEGGVHAAKSSAECVAIAATASLGAPTMLG